MKTLAKDIAAKLGEGAFCVVFEEDLERCWPSNKIAAAKRKRQIEDFAESQGWTAAILEGAFGNRAIFRRLLPTVVSSQQFSERSASSENDKSDIVCHQ
jgi:hypothetical protein